MPTKTKAAKTFPCSDCEFSAKSNAGLSQHLRKHMRQRSEFARMRRADEIAERRASTTTIPVTPISATATPNIGNYTVTSATVRPVTGQANLTASSGASADSPTTGMPKSPAWSGQVVAGTLIVEVPSGTRVAVVYL